MGACCGWLGVRIDGSGGPGPPGPVQGDHVHIQNSSMQSIGTARWCVKIHTLYIHNSVGESEGIISYVCVFIHMYVST